MAILGGLLWGCLEAVAVSAAMKWYLPRLRAASGNGRAVPGACPGAEDQRQSAGAADGAACKALIQSIGILVISIAAAMLCGYVSGNRQTALWSAVRMLFALVVLGVAAMTDMELYTIPNACVLALLAGRAISLIPELIVPHSGFACGVLHSVIAGGGCLLFLLIVAKITHGGIGHGDIKLFSGLGFLCSGRAVVYTMIISFFLCAVVSAVLLLVGKKRWKDVLPLAPFILLGFSIAVILGLF